MSIATGHSAGLFYLLAPSLPCRKKKKKKQKRKITMPSAVILPSSKALNIDSCGCVHKNWNFCERPTLKTVLANGQ